MTTPAPGAGSLGPVTIDDLIKLQAGTIAQFTGGGSGSGYTIEQVYNEVFGLGGAEATGEVVFDRGTQDYVNSRPKKVSTFRDAMKGIHGMDQVQLQTMQQRMWDAGFYAPTAYKKGKNPQSGVADADTIKAFHNLFGTSVMYQGKKTVDEILDDFKMSGGFYSEDERNAAARGYGGGVEIIETSDPATLRQMSVKVGQALLGRAISDHERDAIVNRMLEDQRAPQRAAINAGISKEQQVATAGSGTYVEPAVMEQQRIDAEARMAEEIERRNPEEAAGMAGAGMYQALIEMIQGGHL